MTMPVTVPDLIEPRDVIAGRAQAPGRSLEDWLTDPNSAVRLQRQVATAPAEVNRAIADAVNTGVPHSITTLMAGSIPDTFRAAASRL